MKPVEAITLAEGEILYNEGDDNDSAFVIASGEILLYYTEDGRKVPCEVRPAGSVLGELSILTDQPRRVTAQATTETVVYAVSAAHILDDFNRIGPLLRSCVETSISFSAQLARVKHGHRKTILRRETTIADADAIIGRYKLEIDILDAVAEEKFSMVYQPIVAMEDGRIVGFEALMRWVDDQRGFVPPDQFIPVAEDLGIIGDLTHFALTQSCRTLLQLQDAMDVDYPLSASVNISGQDVARPGFAEALAMILDSEGVAPEQIKLEVTETAIVPDNAIVTGNLERIKSLGCGLSIDDFGTGYSNLAHLKTLPLSALKIDRAFAGDAHCNRVSGSIVSMLVNLGQALNVEIVAEGVETMNDVKALSDRGCSLAQGFYFHRPAAAQDLVAQLARPSLQARVATGA